MTEVTVNVSPVEHPVTVNIDETVTNVVVSVTEQVTEVSVFVGPDATAVIQNSQGTTIITEQIPSGVTEIILIRNSDGTPFENYEVINNEVVIITNSLTDMDGITLTDTNGTILTT